MNFTILTGMSGSGKSKTIQIFEDLGYFCVDNMPPSLIPMLANMLDALTGKFSNIALVVDVRVGDMINELLGQIEELRKMYDVRLIFLDAEEDTLVNRYKETRRSHPLNDPDGLLASIEKERRMLSKLKDNADYVIDTTTFKGTDLRNHLLGIYNMKKAAAFEVKVVSFGFKNGIPIDADMMFDVRCFPNPFYIPELKHKTGKEKEVQDYVMNNPEAKGYFDRIVDMIEYIIPVFRGEGRNSLIIAVGCTGGHHRSVTFVEKLTTWLSNKGLSVKAVHRDIDI